MIYTYRCQKCGVEDDVILPIEHNKPIHCESEMAKVFNPVPFIVVESTKEKVTGGLNEATWMNKEYSKMAMNGFEREKTIF